MHGDAQPPEDGAPEEVHEETVVTEVDTESPMFVIRDIARVFGVGFALMFVGLILLVPLAMGGAILALCVVSLQQALAGNWVGWLWLGFGLVLAWGFARAVVRAINEPGS